MPYLNACSYLTIDENIAIVEAEVFKETMAQSDEWEKDNEGREWFLVKHFVFSFDYGWKRLKIKIHLIIVDDLLEFKTYLYVLLQMTYFITKIYRFIQVSYICGGWYEILFCKFQYYSSTIVVDCYYPWNARFYPFYEINNTEKITYNLRRIEVT